MEQELSYTTPVEVPDDELLSSGRRETLTLLGKYALFLLGSLAVVGAVGSTWNYFWGKAQLDTTSGLDTGRFKSQSEVSTTQPLQQSPNLTRKELTMPPRVPKPAKPERKIRVLHQAMPRLGFIVRTIVRTLKNKSTEDPRLKIFADIEKAVPLLIQKYLDLRASRQPLVRSSLPVLPTAKTRPPKAAKPTLSPQYARTSHNAQVQSARAENAEEWLDLQEQYQKVERLLQDLRQGIMLEIDWLTRRDGSAKFHPFTTLRIQFKEALRSFELTLDGLIRDDLPAG